MRLRYEPILQRDILPAALEIQRHHGLLTNDSIIAACALRTGVEFIVSSDSCFSAVPGLRLVPLDDISPA
jgi:predicted nucleic acid-binding protein